MLKAGSMENLKSFFEKKQLPPTVALKHGNMSEVRTAGPFECRHKALPQK